MLKALKALAQADVPDMADQADLLSLAPRLTCGCLAEWMVQPIMASLLGLGFPIQAANDPDSEVAFAAGPFMLFRCSIYERIGGHRVLAAELVEEVAKALEGKVSCDRMVLCTMFFISVRTPPKTNHKIQRARHLRMAAWGV